MTDHFITEYGKKLDFLPGFYERNKGVALYRQKPAIGVAEVTGPGGKLSGRAPAKDWVTFSGLINFLRANNLLRGWQSGIDLGGGEGTTIRLFKAADLLERATNLDLLDYSNVVDDEYFEAFLQLTESIETLPSTFDGIRETILETKWLYEVGAGQPIMQALHTDFPKEPTLDQNLVMNLLDVTGEYDFVTANATMDFVDLDKALPRIRSILRPGGLFVGTVDLWWWIINATGIVGHIPYLHARLSYSDLVKYKERCQPELNLSHYEYFHQNQQKPSLTMWEYFGQKYGLKMVAVERIIPKRYKFIKDTPQDLIDQGLIHPEDIVDDVTCWLHKVEVDDLKTFALRIAFEAV